MPTTATEAEKIVSIALRRVKLEDLYDTFNDCWNEVGVSSENDSVKESLRMMHELASHAKQAYEQRCCGREACPCSGSE